MPFLSENNQQSGIITPALSTQESTLVKPPVPAFPIVDTAGAWVHHGQFVVAPRQSGPLDGLTFAIKDIYDVQGHRTGFGNPTWLATHPPAVATAPIVQRLLDAGATLLGKVISDEMTYSLNGDNIHDGTPLNANAPERVPGGSSSGSASAVSARLVDFALGSDTGGSTRVPASYCGVWGLRTTHGCLPCDGVRPIHPTFDTLTWLAHDPATFKRVSEVLLPLTAHSFERHLHLQSLWDLADPDFKAPLAAVQQALARRLQATPCPAAVVNAPDTLEDWRQAYATVGARELWSLYGPWIEQHRPAFAPAIAQRIATAATVTADAATIAASRVRTHREALRRLFDARTVAVIPSAASLAPHLAADPATVNDIRMRTMQLTCVAGIGGLPQVSIPLANADGIPVGVSLIGPMGSDRALINLAVQVASDLPR